MIKQCFFTLNRYKRGHHLITSEILNKLEFDLPENGILNLFIQHTSAALTINENADPSVRTDFETISNNLIPDGASFLEHTLEGDDDMPAHYKSSMMGASLNIPIANHRLALGTWQGIYLCEYRNYASARHIVATLYY